MNLDDLLCIKIRNLRRGYSSADLIAVFADFNQKLVCPSVPDFVRSFAGLSYSDIVYAGSPMTDSIGRFSYNWIDISASSNYFAGRYESKPNFLDNPRTWYLRISNSRFDGNDENLSAYRTVFELKTGSGLINHQYSFVVPKDYLES